MPRPLSSTTSSMNWRSEEHTSELQSLWHLVCRLLLEKNIFHHSRYALPLLSKPQDCCTTRAGSPRPGRQETGGCSPPRHPAPGGRLSSLFFFNDPRPPEISPLPLHAALPICHCQDQQGDADVHAGVEDRGAPADQLKA